MSTQRSQFLPRSGIPDLQDALIGSGRQQPAVRVELDGPCLRLIRARYASLLPRGKVEELNLAAARPCERLAIRAQREGRQKSVAEFDRSLDRACFQVPESHIDRVVC